MKVNVKSLSKIAMAIFCFTEVHFVIAQDVGPYPIRSIHMIVPFAPGAGTDLSIRTIAPKWSELMGQPIVVDNRVGASGIVGTTLVYKSASDGYTLLFTATDLAINPALFSKIPYDAMKDLMPVGRAVNFPNFLVVNADFPLKTVTELIALAKEKPGSLSYGTAGNGTPPHISAELFKQLTKTDLTHVPYKGSAQAMTDVIGGQIQLMFVNTVSATQYVRNGRLRVLGITTAQRASFAPEVPTIAEAGVPGYELVTWTGVTAPQGTSREVIAKLNRELVKALENPELKEKLTAQGSIVTPSTPEQYGLLIANDTRRLGQVAKIAKMHID
ncbi:MAG: tripartite tricarboxylate transporter substrate binding protein [Betaproteobacteria bacterium]